MRRYPMSNRASSARSLAKSLSSVNPRPLRALVLLTVIGAFCGVACNKSRVLGHKSPPAPSATASSMVIDEQRDYVAIVRREQLELRADLQDEIDDIDRKLGELHVRVQRDGQPEVALKRKDAKRVTELLERRQLLTADLTRLDRSDESGWENLKVSIEHDLTPKTRGRRGHI